MLSLYFLADFEAELAELLKPCTEPLFLSTPNPGTFNLTCSRLGSGFLSLLALSFGLVALEMAFSILTDFSVFMPSFER